MIQIDKIAHNSFSRKFRNFMGKQSNIKKVDFRIIKIDQKKQQAVGYLSNKINWNFILAIQKLSYFRQLWTLLPYFKIQNIKNPIKNSSLRGGWLGFKFKEERIYRYITYTPSY